MQRFMVTLLIEETMRLAFIQVQITANSQSLHATLKLLGSGHRYQPILRTHEDNGGRHALMNPMHEIAAIVWQNYRPPRTLMAVCRAHCVFYKRH